MRLILSRSLARLQGKILGAASALSPVASALPVCHLQRLSLSKAVAKVQTFSFMQLLPHTFLQSFFRFLSNSLIHFMLWSIFFIIVRKRMWNNLHYIIRAGAYVYARKGKRDGSNGNEGIFQHTFSLQKNARAFDLKRKCVSIQTQGRFSSNASAFGVERKGIFSRTKTKGNITRERA